MADVLSAGYVRVTSITALPAFAVHKSNHDESIKMNISTTIPHAQALIIGNQVYVECPYCYGVHIHGGTSGHRVPHCQIHGQRDHGYTFDGAKPTEAQEKEIKARYSRCQKRGYLGSLVVVAQMVTADMFKTSGEPTASGFVAVVEALKAARRAGATVSLRQAWIASMMKETRPR